MHTVCLLRKLFAWNHDGLTDVIQFTEDGHGFMQRVSWVLVFPLSISFFNSLSEEMRLGLGWWLIRCLSPSNFPQSVTEGGRMWEVWLSISSVFLLLILTLTPQAATSTNWLREMSLVVWGNMKVTHPLLLEAFLPRFPLLSVSLFLSHPFLPTTLTHRRRD